MESQQTKVTQRNHKVKSTKQKGKSRETPDLA